MSKMTGHNLILNAKESENLLKNLLHPDMDKINQRDNFLKDFRSKYTVHDDGSVCLSLPDISIPNILSSDYGKGKDKGQSGA